MKVYRALEDGLVIAKRNLIKIRRVPDVLTFVLFEPVMFVLLFSYVLGSAVEVPGGSYREFLMAGIFAQTVLFGSNFTAVGLAYDMQRGIIDRFRTLPISRAAVIMGRTLADAVYNLSALLITALTGLLVGWRPRGGLFDALLGFALLLVFAYAVSWVMAWIGLLVPSFEVVYNASYLVIFPISFIADTFVPYQNLPGALRGFAEWNPVSALAQAARELFGNLAPGTPAPAAWPLRNPVVYTLLWAAAVIAVFAPLSVRLYNRTSKNR